MFPDHHVPSPSQISSTVNRLLLGPRSQTTPSDLNSDVDTDYMAANRKEAERQMTAKVDAQGSRQGILRPSTQQSIKSKSAVSIQEVGKESEKSSPVPSKNDFNENVSLPESCSGNGNEADVDTVYTDAKTLEVLSQISGQALTREEIQREYSKILAERLIQAALLAGAKDNLTVMVVLFPGCGL